MKTYTWNSSVALLSPTCQDLKDKKDKISGANEIHSFKKFCRTFVVDSILDQLNIHKNTSQT